MKYTHLILPAVLAAAFFGGQAFSKQQTQEEQIKTLEQRLSALKKTYALEKEQMQRDIEFLQIGNRDINTLLETHDIRLMTNKILIQGTIEGSIAQLKEAQDETSAGYARTRKIVWAALAFGAFAVCAFIVALVLIHLRNKKIFLLITDTLSGHAAALEKLTRIQERDFADLKTELSQLRAEWRLGAEARHKAIEENRHRITQIETAAAAHKKLSEERTASLAYFQQQMEDNLLAIKKSAEAQADELKKQLSAMEVEIEMTKEHIDKNKITR